MARYFFHTVNGGRDFDEEGVELAGDTAAHLEAVRFAGAMLYDRPELLSDGRDYRVEVIAPTGDLLFTVVMCSVSGMALERIR